MVFSERWVHLFTSDPHTARLAVAAMPVLGLCDCPQTTGCGVLRGTARPGVGARINLLSFYLVGTPVAVYLAFGAPHAGFQGLWYGLVSAQASCVALVLAAVVWRVEAMRAKNLAAAEAEDNRVVAANGELAVDDV